MIQREEYPLTCLFKSHPLLPSAKAQKLIPRFHIPRSCLPLAYLDPSGGRDDLLGSNLFSGYIGYLEKIVREDLRSSQPTVLIAQSALDDGLFAIERAEEGIYAMCRLGHWVDKNMLERLLVVPVDVARPQKRQSQEQPRLHGNSWWSIAAIGFMRESNCDPGKNSGVGKTRGVRLCLQMPQQKLTAPAQVNQEIEASIMQSQVDVSLESMVEEVAQDPEEILRTVRTQYQEALYASKVSFLSCPIYQLHY